MSLVFMTALLCPPARAQARLEIADVDNSRRAGLSIQPVCGVDAKTEADRKFIELLWTRYAGVYALKDWRSFGPDSAYRRITLAWADKKIILESWHPIVERGGKGVAMSYGVTALDGRSLTDALKTDDAKYVRRRAVFDTIVRECAERKKAR